jgi:5-methylcytosine-specific restriction enzyme subunit McrC
MRHETVKSDLLIRRSLSEWNSIDLPEVTLNRRDWEFINNLNIGSAKLLIEARPAGIRVTTRSWIGVVRLNSLEIRVEPKLAGDHIRVVEMLELTSGLDLLRRYANHHQLKTGADNLFDLIATLLVTESERLLAGGLLSDYRDNESAIPFVRGRILASEQVLKRFGQIDQIHCSFDERTEDIAENRVIAAALSICRRLVKAPGLKQRIHRCLSGFLEYCTPSSDDRLKSFTSLNYDRLNSHYKTAHEFSDLVFTNFHVEEFSADGDSKVFSFLLDMNKLFEKFIEKLLEHLCRQQDLRPSFQKRNASVICDADTGQSFAEIRPDVLLKSQTTGIAVPVDTKYKRLDDTKVNNGDIYQLFFYASAFGKPTQPKRAFIFYPASTVAGKFQRIKIRCNDNSSAIITLVGIHIPTVISEMRSRSPQCCLLQLKTVLQSSSMES